MEEINAKHPMIVLLTLNQLREESVLTDVVLEVEGKSFPCHRAVLASSSSPYFHKMFTGGYAEAKQERITIHDVGEASMATILDYIYTGCLQMEPDQVQDLMSAARLLQMKFVYEKATEYMEYLLDVTNCADVLMYADMVENRVLEIASRRYMASRFNQVSLQPSFLQLSLPQLQSLLYRHDLIVNSENDVVQAALRWIEFDEERKQHLPDLCKSFRQSFLSSEHLTELESKNVSADCKLVYNNDKLDRQGQRRSETLVFLKEVASWTSPTRMSAPCYEPSSSMLLEMSTRNIPEDLHASSMVVTSDDELYLAGGQRGEVLEIEPQKVFFQYNHLLNAWEPRCDMISPRVRCGLVYLQGYIYAIGSDKKDQTAERYDPSCDEWTSIEPIPYPVSRLCAVALNDSIYVISREGCYCFRPTENTWNKTADMLWPPRTPHVISFQGCLFCVDCDKGWGDTPLTFVEMYNPAEGVWKRCGTMSFSCYYTTLVCYGGSLYLLIARIKNPSSLGPKKPYRLDSYQYQPESNSWLPIEDTARIVPRMREWLGSGGRARCLVARMIPVCLQWDGNESSDDGKEWWGTDSSSSRSELSDQDTSDDEGDESDNDDI